MADFSLSRMIKEKYKDRPVELSKKAREKFISLSASPLFRVSL
jgi:hypothetical protein